jgi:hypothetical protein
MTVEINIGKGASDKGAIGGCDKSSIQRQGK